MTTTDHSKVETVKQEDKPASKVKTAVETDNADDKAVTIPDKKHAIQPEPKQNSLTLQKASSDETANNIKEEAAKTVIEHPTTKDKEASVTPAIIAKTAPKEPEVNAPSSVQTIPVLEQPTSQLSSVLVPSQSPEQKPVLTSSAPAPVKTRRVPPGGHTTALW